MLNSLLYSKPTVSKEEIAPHQAVIKIVDQRELNGHTNQDEQGISGEELTTQQKRKITP